MSRFIGRTCAWLRRIIEVGDPAALLPPAAVNQLAASLENAGVQSSQPFLGGEAEPSQLMHVTCSCPFCGQAMTSRPSMSANAVVLDVNGPLRKHHVPIRCDSPTCVHNGLYQWHNYYVLLGRHVFNGMPGSMQVIMLTSRFGVSIAFLEQLHLRLLREHVSFAGEADVARRFSQRRGTAHLLPKRLRLYLSQAWYVWRLMLCREMFVDEALPELDLRRPVEEYIAQAWPLLVAAFESTTARRARQAGMKTDVQVMDGNAKNRRLVCAAFLRHMLTCHRLGRSVCVGCPHTPLLGSAFCSDHASEESADVDYEIVTHEIPEPGGLEIGASLRLLVRQTSGKHEEVWVDEQFVDPRMSNAYFKRIGDKSRAAAADKRRKRMLDRQVRMKQIENDMDALAEIWTELTPENLEQILSERSTADDLSAVACNTHKETDSERQDCARTAGLLVACLSCGIITSMCEVLGCESLSQRYLFLSALVALYPELVAMVHDDACHLHKFCERRAHCSVAAARLAPPRMHYICDVFHMVGHTDSWCTLNCNPRAPHLVQYVDGVRTSVCEFTFTWFSQYKHQSKHMSEWGFKFFLQQMCAAHNDAIFDGDESHLTHRSS